MTSHTRSYVVLLAITLGCGSGDDETATTSKCERVRAQIVELQLRDVAAPGVDLAAHRATMTAALGDDFLSTCSELSSSQVACVLASADSATATACLGAR